MTSPAPPKSQQPPDDAVVTHADFRGWKKFWNREQCAARLRLEAVETVLGKLADFLESEAERRRKGGTDAD